MACHHRQEEAAHGRGCCHHVSRWPLPPAIAVFWACIVDAGKRCGVVNRIVKRSLPSGLLIFRGGAFLLAGGQIAADQGRNSHDQRQGTAPRAGPLPATDNGHAGSADSGRTAGRASQGQPSRRRSRRHRGPQATPGRREGQHKRTAGRAGRRNQPQRDRHTREPKGNSKHKSTT